MYLRLPGSARALVAGTVVILVSTAWAPTASSAAAPTPAPKPWRQAASQLDMVVYRPTDTAGLKLGFVRKIVDPYCPDLTSESLRGMYTVRGRSTRTIEVFEGSPRYCNGTSLRGRAGAKPLLVHGKKGVVVNLCDVRDCTFREGAWGLEWCERGTTVQLIAEGVSKGRLLRFGRSFRTVDAARGTVPPLADS